jgi:starch-binding outer membrane protein, SusD/RagB family
MKKIFKILIFLSLPLGIHAQNDSAVSVSMKRIFSELCSSQKYSNTHWVIGECITDNSETGGENTDDITNWQNMMLFNEGPCNTTFEEYWMRSYNIIAQANKIIADMPGTTFSEDKKKLNIAEAKFVRSLAYFDLITIFGGVPIYTDTMAWEMPGYYADYSGNFIFKARNSIAEVFAQIESDLTEAIPSLPGRTQLDSVYYATKGAAKALLSKKYLYQSSYAKNYPGDSRFSGLTQQWDKALQYAEEIINSGEYELVGSNGETYSTWWDNSYLYTNTHGFRYMFTKAGNDCSESVFEVRNLFAENDRWLPYTANGISMFTTCRYIIGNNDISTNLGWGFNCPTQELINEFALESGNAKKDPRFQVTVGIDGDLILDRDSIWRKIDITRSPTQAVCRKYEESPNEYQAHNSWSCGTSNIKIIRYAEVLLWAAEAALEVSDNAKAIKYINMVRSRARNCGKTGFPKDLTSITFNDIAHERRLELALEGHRFFDLVRWNLAYSKLNGRFNESYQTPVAFTRGVNEFFPVPGSVMANANGVVTQNNGYDPLCAHLDGIPDLFIKTGTVSTEIDFTGKYSSITFEEPDIYITLSNPAFASISLTNKKLKINYNTLADGDTTEVTLSMNDGNSNTLQTSFMIRAIQPLFTATDDDINKVYTSWSYTYEIKPFHEKYGLDPKNVTLSGVIFRNGISFNYYRSYSGTFYDPQKGFSFSFYKYRFYDLVKTENLKSDGIIPILLVLVDRATKKYYGIDVPVKVSDIIPFININRPQLAGNEISFELSTTAINNEDSSLFSSPSKYRRSGFRFDVNYDPDNLEYLGYNYDGSFIKDITHDVNVKNSEGSIEFSDTNSQPIIGEGKLVTLLFKDLGSGLGTITADNFGYIVWYESTMPGDISNDYLSWYDSYNILTGNDVIEIGEKPKAAKSAIQLFPNPAIDDISVDADFDNYSIILYSIDGRLISSFKSNSSSMKIPVNNMASGLYIVKIIKDGESQNLKFIKK